LPAILVYGTPSSPELTQASWFWTEDKDAVKAAAETLKFSVIELRTDAEKALSVGVHEGVLKGSGRMIGGSVSSDAYQRIVDYVGRTASAGAPSNPEDATAAAQNLKTEQSMNNASAIAAAPAPKNAEPIVTAVKPAPVASSAAPPSAKTDKLAATPNPWDALRVGSYVVGKYWTADGEAYGWWIGVITAIDKDDFMIRWPDEPNTPPHKIARKHVAILNPEFDVTREWERRR
jgi:hypothetical protein